MALETIKGGAFDGLTFDSQPLTEEEKAGLQADQEGYRRHQKTVYRPSREISGTMRVNGDENGCAKHVQAELARIGKGMPSANERLKLERKLRELESSGKPYKMLLLTPANPFGEPDLIEARAGAPIPPVGKGFTYRGHPWTVRHVMIETASVGPHIFPFEPVVSMIAS